MIRAFLAMVGGVAVLAAALPMTDLRSGRTEHTRSRFAAPTYETLPEWEVRRAALRRQVLAAAGLWPLPERCPLRPWRVVSVDAPGYRIEKVLLQTLPGYWLAGNLYVPKGPAERHPGVLLAHGHWPHGRVEHRPDYSVPAMGVNLALQGYVAFAYDMVGYNDTRQTPHGFGQSAREQLWAFGPLGLQLWNSMRAADFLESLPEVDGTRLAMTGASGGGTQTLLMTAVDERVRVSAPVNMVSSVMQGGSPCENAPGLRVGTNNVELAALAAPRPMLLVATTRDWTRQTPWEEFPGVERVYRLFGVEPRVGYVQFDAEHNYNQASREAVYGFLGRHLLGRTTDGPVPEAEGALPRPEELLVGISRPAVATRRFAELFAEWRHDAEMRTLALGRREQRERLVAVLHTRWPDSVESLQTGEQVALSGVDGDRVPGLWLPGTTGRAALVLHPDGAEAARQTEAVRRLVREGASVLLLSLYRAPAEKGWRSRYHHTFHESDGARRVQDALTGLAWLRERASGRVRLIGLGTAGYPALFAAAVAPMPVELSVSGRELEGSDWDLERHFFVPGLQWAGGVRVARQLAGGEAQGMEAGEGRDRSVRSKSAS